jgi:murein DD-endopeptidase MepM/ murein hydrolase activator NlpD
MEHRMRIRWRRRRWAVPAWTFGFVLIASAVLQGQQAHLAIRPARPLPGAIVRLSLTDAGASDAIVAVSGTMAGEPLHFIGIGRAWRAIGAVPVDSGNAIVAHVTATRASGRTDTLSASVTPPPLPPPKEQLAVAQRFGKPMDAATAARVERENRRAMAVGRQSQQEPPKWTAPFRKPRTSEISSGFGTGRTFNGQVASRHLGVDFRGAQGAPIRAANAGVVALVDHFFLGGNVVYIDHGGGLTTGYLHLSKTLVHVGDHVARGQVIGLVGATGRVTGPHLHWMARYGALTVNPLDLLTLEPLPVH